MYEKTIRMYYSQVQQIVLPVLFKSQVLIELLTPVLADVLKDPFTTRRKLVRLVLERRVQDFVSQSRELARGVLSTLLDQFVSELGWERHLLLIQFLYYYLRDLDHVVYRAEQHVGIRYNPGREYVFVTWTSLAPVLDLIACEDRSFIEQHYRSIVQQCYFTLSGKLTLLDMAVVEVQVSP